MLGNPFAIPRQAAQDVAEEFAAVRDVKAIPVSVQRSVHVDQDHVVIVCNNNQEASIPRAGLLLSKKSRRTTLPPCSFRVAAAMLRRFASK